MAFIIGKEQHATLVLPGASLVVPIFLPKARPKGPIQLTYLRPFSSKFWSSLLKGLVPRAGQT